MKDFQIIRNLRLKIYKDICNVLNNFICVYIYDIFMKDMNRKLLDNNFIDFFIDI